MNQKTYFTKVVQFGVLFEKIKSRGTLSKLNKSMKMDNSMSKILTKTVILGPLIKQRKRAEYWPNQCWNFHVLLNVSFFKDFRYKTFRNSLCLQITLIQSIFVLEKCSFFLNRLKLFLKLIGYIISIVLANLLEF